MKLLAVSAGMRRQIPQWNECAVRSIAATWSWPEQLKLWRGLKKELHREMALACRASHLTGTQR